MIRRWKLSDEGTVKGSSRNLLINGPRKRVQFLSESIDLDLFLNNFLMTLSSTSGHEMEETLKTFAGTALTIHFRQKFLIFLSTFPRSSLTPKGVIQLCQPSYR